MRKLFRSLCLLFVLLAVAAKGQSQDCCKKLEAFAGYSYLNVSPKTDRLNPNVLSPRTSQHGLGVDVAYSFKKAWAIVGDFSRQTADVNSIQADATTLHFLGGLRLLSRAEGLTSFVEALFGASMRKAVLGTARLSNTDLA